MSSMLYAVIVGLIAGWATGKIMKGSGYGVLVDIILGIVGGILGNWILGLLGFATSGGLDRQHPGCDPGSRNPSRNRAGVEESLIDTNPFIPHADSQFRLACFPLNNYKQDTSALLKL